MKFNNDRKRKILWSAKLNKIKSFYFDFNLVNKDSFCSIVLNNFEFGNTYSLLLRVEFNYGKYAMAGNQIGFQLDNVNYLEVIDNLYNEIMDRLDSFHEFYHVEHIDSVQVLFVKVQVLPKLKLQNINDLQLPKKLFNVKEIKSKYNSNLLPLTLDTDYYGKLIIGDECTKYDKLISKYYSLIYEDGEFMYDYMHIYNNKYIILSTELDNNKIFREVFSLKLGTLEGKFTDTILSPTSFERQYKSVKFTINNDKITKIINEDKTLPIITRKHMKKDNLTSSNPFIGTFDLEAFDDVDGYAKVYALGFCVLNQDPITFYLDKNDNKDLIVECFKVMLTNKYNGYTFYIHNLNYDGVFILNKLKAYNNSIGEEFFQIKAFYKDSRILKLEVINNKNKIIFADSANLLRGKLRDLAKSFGLEMGKGFWPYKFISRNTLNYIGDTPSYDYWEDVSLDDYNKLIKPDWNLKEECLLYLEKDLLTLLNVMNLFNKYVYQKFDIQMTDSLTISRLSLNIFVKDYLKDSKIPIIKGNMYDDIKLGYYGGVTEVYKPYGENLLYYDVNSLYPYVALNPMCGNKYTFIESMSDNISLNDLFGFFYCKIEAKSNYLGLLPLRTKTGLLMPIGEWEGWYFSEELKFAAENGYKITVVKGYNFNKEYNVFNDYIKTLYKVKSTTKNVVEKSVMKSLLNNLLGRFGLNINKPITELVDLEKLDLLMTTRHCNSFTKISDNDFLISYYPSISKNICEMHGVDYVKALSENKIKDYSEFNDVSLVISAAITAYARVHMSKVKLDILSKKGNIYYTDTDSIITNIKLNDNLVGNELGQFKMEYDIVKGYFISSKTYCLVLRNHKNSFVCKSKGIENRLLTVEDYENLYNGIDIQYNRKCAVRNYEVGSVVLKDGPFKIDHNAYKKRIKVFNSNSKWIDTKPITLESGVVKCEDIKLNSRSPPYRRIFKILYNLTKELLLFSLSVLIVCFIGDNIDFNDQNTIDYIPDVQSSNVVHKNRYDCMKKPKILDYLIMDAKVPKPNNYINFEYYRYFKVHKVYTSVVNEIISNNLVTNEKFTNLSSIVDFSKNYLLKEIELGHLKVTAREFEEVIKLVYNTKKNNNALYEYICEEPSLYNIISKSYISKYEMWSMNPNKYDEPGPLVVKNELTIFEELESLNHNYTTILKEYDSINSNIRRSLTIPRSEIKDLETLNSEISPSSISSTSTIK